MIHFTAHNSEHQLAIGFPDDAYDIRLSNDNGIYYYTPDSGECFTKHLGIQNFGIDFEILGTFDKEKNVVDFEVQKNWVEFFHDTIYSEDGIGRFNWKFKGSKLVYTTKEYAYIGFLESITKESKENKFVILKQL